MNASWRRWPAVLVIAALTMAGAGCNGDGEPKEDAGATGSAGPVLWAHPGSLEELYRQSVARFNAGHPQEKMTLKLWPNDPYKQKVREAFGGTGGSIEPPDVFFNWGGGNISSYVEAGKIAELTGEFDADPAWKNTFFATALDAATFHGRRYGVPMNGMQPIVFFYNKDVFTKVGASPPKTFDDLLALIRRLRSAGATPIALGGASKWTYLMYAEYLVDRLAGPGAFKAVADGRPGAWAQPAFSQASTMIRQLVDAGAFEPDFARVSYDTGASSALLTSGKAAMELMGTWQVPNLIDKAPAFVAGGKLGWFTFPLVRGGAGNPKDVVGSPTNFYSIRAGSDHRQASVDFVKKIVMDDTYVDWLIGKGEVPPVKGIERKLATAPHADWLSFVYSTVKQAPSFQLSWDQTLLPAQADILLANLDRLFRKQITPSQFSANMATSTR